MSEPVQDQFATRRASGIAEHTRAKLAQLFEATPGVDRVWLFGSRARGDFRNESDIDLAVEGRGLSSADFSRLNGRLESMGLMYRVDMVNLSDTLDARFRQQIERDRKLGGGSITAALFSTLTPCSSVPVRKNTSSPRNRIARAHTSQTVVVYAWPMCGRSFT